MKYLTLFFFLLMHRTSHTQPPTLVVKHTTDFSFDGTGQEKAWEKADWISLKKLDAADPENKTRFKILYGDKGIYVLFHGEDQRISTDFDTDFSDLYEGDVFEVFFHPNPKQPVYFEYEVNALDKELVLLIPNLNGTLMGWLPWKYEGARKVTKSVKVEGGAPVKNGTITSWSAELLFPYELIQPLIKGKPARGTVWNANFYRLDYDTGKMVKWAWSAVNRNFHEFEKFGTIRFE